MTKSVFLQTCQTFRILKTVRFQNQNLEVQKNSENLRVLGKNWFHCTKSADEFICRVRIRTPGGLIQIDSKFANKCQISRRSLNPFAFGSGRFLETFQTYRFQKSGLKEYTVRKKKAAENGIGFKKECTLKCSETKSCNLIG